VFVFLDKSRGVMVLLLKALVSSGLSSYMLQALGKAKG